MIKNICVIKIGLLLGMSVPFSMKGINDCVASTDKINAIIYKIANNGNNEDLKDIKYIFFSFIKNPTSFNSLKEIYHLGNNCQIKGYEIKNRLSFDKEKPLSRSSYIDYYHLSSEFYKIIIEILGQYKGFDLDRLNLLIDAYTKLDEVNFLINQTSDLSLMMQSNRKDRVNSLINLIKSNFNNKESENCKSIILQFLANPTNSPLDQIYRLGKNFQSFYEAEIKRFKEAKESEESKESLTKKINLVYNITYKIFDLIITNVDSKCLSSPIIRDIHYSLGVLSHHRKKYIVAAAYFGTAALLGLEEGKKVLEKLIEDNLVSEDYLILIPLTESR